MTLPLLINGSPVPAGPRYQRPADPPRPRLFDNLDAVPVAPHEERTLTGVARRMRGSAWWFQYAPEPVKRGDPAPPLPQGSNNPPAVAGEIVERDSRADRKARARAAIERLVDEDPEAAKEALRLLSARKREQLRRSL